jgi:hypothetical protein
LVYWREAVWSVARRAREVAGVAAGCGAQRTDGLCKANAVDLVVLVMVVLVVTCAETSILLCYLQLCNEDYRWWWR